MNAQNFNPDKFVRDRIKRRRHHEMLENPGDWPRWPMLPMKRSLDYSPNLGFVTADFPTVILEKPLTMTGILVQLACEDGEGMPVLGSDNNLHYPKNSKARKMYEDKVIKRYTDIDAMLDDGWEID